MSESNRHRHHHDRERVTREYDRPKHSPPNDRPFSRRNYDHRQHDNDRNPIHTVFLFNLNFNTTVDQLKEFASEFGEIAPGLFYQPPKKKGMVFITYYDIRNAIRMVDEGRGRVLNGNPIKTAYAYQPPKYSKRDPRDICSSTIYESTSNDSKVTIDDIRPIAEEAGEIRFLTEVSKGKFDIVYYDLRSAKTAVEKKEVLIKDELFKIDYNLEEGIGDSPVLNENYKTKSYSRESNSDKSDKSNSRHHSDSKRSKSPSDESKSQSQTSTTSFQFPVATPGYPYPYQYTFGYPYPYGYQYTATSDTSLQVPVSAPVPMTTLNTNALANPSVYPGLQPQYQMTVGQMPAPVPLNQPVLPQQPANAYIPQQPIAASSAPIIATPPNPTSLINSYQQTFYQAPNQPPPQINQPVPPPLPPTPSTSMPPIKPPSQPKSPAPEKRPTFDMDIFSQLPTKLPSQNEEDILRPLFFEDDTNNSSAYQPPKSSQISQNSSTITPAQPISMDLPKPLFGQTSNDTSKASALEKMVAILS